MGKLEWFGGRSETDRPMAPEHTPPTAKRPTITHGKHKNADNDWCLLDQGRS